VMTALEATGLLPSRSHELVRNLMVSPASGRDGGRADLRPIAETLDRELCADPVLAGLPGRFLFVLDDGRGDVVERPCDLGLVALDADSAQLRVGDGWGDVVPLSDAPARLLDLARRFLERRGAEADAAWHVAELDDPLVEPRATDPRVPPGRAPMPYGPVACGLHVAVPREGLHRTDLAWLPEHPGPSGSPEGSADVVVTPWHGILVPEARS
jgi:precorrin-3B synthase